MPLLSGVESKVQVLEIAPGGVSQQLQKLLCIPPVGVNTCAYGCVVRVLENTSSSPGGGHRSSVRCRPPWLWGSALATCRLGTHPVHSRPGSPDDGSADGLAPDETRPPAKPSQARLSRLCSTAKQQTMSTGFFFNVSSSFHSPISPPQHCYHFTHILFPDWYNVNLVFYSFAIVPSLANDSWCELGLGPPAH